MRGFFLLPLLIGAGAALAQGPEVRVGEDPAELPPAVQETRAALIEVARSGDIEGLRAIIEAQGSTPTVSFGLPDDPVGYLKETSGDEAGREILAILLNALEMPHAVLGNETEGQSFAWPYLSQLDPTELTPEQEVDAYRLVSVEELQGIRDFGGWIHWRVFIGPDGEWQAFVAGD